MLVVSVAVVETCGDVANCWRSSKLLMEEGGLVASAPAPSSDRLGNLAVAKEVESRLSLEGFPRGGGMLRLALLVAEVVVSVWGPLRTSVPLLAASSVCVAVGLLLRLMLGALALLPVGLLDKTVLIEFVLSSSKS